MAKALLCLVVGSLVFSRLDCDGKRLASTDDAFDLILLSVINSWSGLEPVFAMEGRAYCRNVIACVLDVNAAVLRTITDAADGTLVSCDFTAVVRRSCVVDVESGGQGVLMLQFGGGPSGFTSSNSSG